MTQPGLQPDPASTGGSGAHAWEGDAPRAGGLVTGSERAEARAAETSVGDLFADVSKDLSTLMRQELELAKAELRESAKRAGKGAGMLVGASEAARFTLLFLSVALWAGLADPLGGGWSALIVAAVWLVIAIILALVGKQNLTSVRGLPQTTETVQEIPDALKPGKDMP